jgi:hypothetical protein
MYDVRCSCTARQEASPDQSIFDSAAWLFTDSRAVEHYARQGFLALLHDDIRALVLCGGQWTDEELEFQVALQRLKQKGVLNEKGTFSFLSPHATVYRAAAGGALQAAGQKYHFEVGDDVVFWPWLARAYYPGRTGVVWIGRLRTTHQLRLNAQAFPRASALCECALRLLRSTLSCRSTPQLAHAE